MTDFTLQCFYPVRLPCIFPANIIPKCFQPFHLLDCLEQLWTIDYFLNLKHLLGVCFLYLLYFLRHGILYCI